MPGESPVTVGVVGCGKISGVYLANCNAFPNLRVRACADLNMERARESASQFRVPHVCSVEELLADEAIEVVLNLTLPAAHTEISFRALESGKHVYSEKPLAISRDDGRRILEMAVARDLRVGCAPDTFLGGGLQTCRRLIDEGAIGDPVAATAFYLSDGHETWHPDPDFFYRPGGGPMLDMGPYSITALVTLLGPIRRVTGSTRITFPERTITSSPRSGERIRVDVPTHVTGVMDFAIGPIATIITSFDVHSHELPPLEIYGAEGTIRGPNPGTFRGPVWIRRAGEREWTDVPVTGPYTRDSRGLGLAEMAAAIRSDGPHRASGDLAYHVLDVMQAFEDASRQGRHIDMTSTCRRPEPFGDGRDALGRYASTRSA